MVSAKKKEETLGTREKEREQKELLLTEGEDPQQRTVSHMETNRIQTVIQKSTTGREQQNTLYFQVMKQKKSCWTSKVHFGS